MWLRLDDNLAGFLTELLQRELQETRHVDEEVKAKVQEIFDKLNELPDPDDHHFIMAVETSDDLEVDADAIVSRSDEGAFVMSWSWVSNETAGVEPEKDDDE